ncbi:MAG TPA: 2-oxoacid:acceptor oxidoreductase subunit alpha, partial [Arenibaculum sp.]|nr:2-oxoacid:acceptor oxidoreductase subunit alpha [Arenibaculum sp.]
MLDTLEPPNVQSDTIDRAVVRLAGDSGDGIQVAGGQFTLATALAGNDLATFPDFPAEIRAPTGTTFGVSAYQIQFGSDQVRTAGDSVDVLVAFNPAALKVNLPEVRPGGLVIVDSDAFTEKGIAKAGYAADPLAGDTLGKYRVLSLDLSSQTTRAVADTGVSHKEAQRCKNIWALGLVYWLFGRDREPTRRWIEGKFSADSAVGRANLAALDAGHAFGETAELPAEVRSFTVPRARLAPGTYRTVTGTEALAWGLVAGAQFAGLGMTFCSYPITPASQILHTLARLKKFGVVTFQAEDEIAAACAAIGASFAGNLGITASSGPGIALKTEAIGLAVATELPLVVVNAQRGGPSTGLPTKTEQSDLYLAVWGRNGDSPLPVIATRSPSDCFEVAVEAVRIATKYMTPVMLLTDGYVANAAEPWRLPDVGAMEPFPVRFETSPEGFQPFRRDPETLARVWAKPGTPELEHRIGGLERDYDTGNISYDSANHQRMTDARAGKIDGIARDIPLQEVDQGDTTGRIAVVGWGSTYGPINRAVSTLRAEGAAVSHIHLRYIWPLPANLGELLAGFEQILVPEMNTGQLTTLLRARYLVPARCISQVTGKPFKVGELAEIIR